MTQHRLSGTMQALFALALTGGTCLSSLPAWADGQLNKSQPLARVAPQHSALDWHARESGYYKRNWGIDVVGVHPLSSGQMLEFRYYVLNARKARPLFDKNVRPYLIDNATGIRLAVPTMENIGELRQSSTPNRDRVYFTIFGNPGKLVKPGSSVSVVIGEFHIDDLTVD